MTKKYDEQLRDMRHCLGYVFNKMGVVDIPDFLKDDLATTISEVRIENKDLVKVLSDFDKFINKLRDNK